MLNEPALTFNAYHLGGPGQGSREELDEHSQRRSGPEEWRPDPCSIRRHGRRSLAPDARQPGPVGAGHRRRRPGRYRDLGDCAIKVLLPGLDAKQTPVGQVISGDPVTVKPDDQLEGCMAMMAARSFRHLPVLDAGKVVGVISIGDVVKDIIRNLEHNVGDLMGYIMTDGPGG